MQCNVHARSDPLGNTDGVPNKWQAARAVCWANHQVGLDRVQDALHGHAPCWRQGVRCSTAVAAWLSHLPAGWLPHAALLCLSVLLLLLLVLVLLLLLLQRFVPHSSHLLLNSLCDVHL